MTRDNVPGSPSRPLPVLRALLDAIDRDVLQLLARRMGVVAEIAAYKRHSRTPIRDLAREREVLRDRAERGALLGLPQGVIESVYRMLLLASRDRQAELRAEVPEDQAPKTVAIIGGEGGMGRSMARLFGDLGHAVLVSDVDTALRPAEAARLADVVIVSVPIRVTEQVIRELGPLVREDALMMDVTSIKEMPLRAMMAHCRGSVLGTHPMFGPGAHSFTGQRVVLCPGRGEAWQAWAAEAFRSRGLVVTETSAEAHDRAMSIVQVLNHFQTQVMGLALARAGVPLEETLAFTSPTYLLEAYVVGRHFAQSPGLYGPIEMFNPRVAEVTSGFRAAAEELTEILTSGDQPRFDAVFDEVRAYLGPAFTEEALEQSRFLVDRLVELTAGR
ncbi:MAG: bifunctional chorismate mutase/prephenate dehydrogenase [Myxococcales bacterium]|nr:bifunctional chorismate mutase/prephenate dehydrogenase [Myxococcales bacterium]